MIVCVCSYAECCCQVLAKSHHHRLTICDNSRILRFILRYSLHQGRAEDVSNMKGAVVKMIRTAITAAIVALFSFLLLPMLGAFGQKADADELAPGVTTLRFFEHDTQQTNLDLHRSEEGPGDQSLFSGDVFDHAGGTKVGHTAGQCTALSGNAAAGDILCTQTFLLEGGQITIQGLADRAALFGRGETVPFAIVGEAQESTATPAATALSRCRPTYLIRPTRTLS